MTKKISLITLFSFILLNISSYTTTASMASNTASGEDKYFSWVEFGGQFGHESQIGTIDFFIPVSQDDSNLWFFDLRAQDTNGSASEGNVALAFRHLMDDRDAIFGIYSFLDRRRSQHDNYFNQVVLGSELIYEDWDFRVNGYLPEGGSKLVSETVTVDGFVSGTSIISSTETVQVREVALPGFDAEFGVKVPIEGQDVRFYAGGFHFNNDEAPNVQGPRLRTEWRLDNVFNIEGSRITLEADVQHDKVRDWEYFLGAAVRVPLDFGSKKNRYNGLKPIERRMLDPIIRDIDVVTQNQAPKVISTVKAPAIDPATGQPFADIVFAEQGGAGTGTQADPTDINTAVGQAGANGVIVPLNTAGTITTGGIDLLAGQSLVGPGGTIAIQNAQGQNGTLSISDPTNSGVPTIDGTGGTVVDLANNNTISNLTITGGGDGIAGDNVSNIMIRDVTIDDSGSDGGTRGIDIGTSGSNISILNSTISNRGNDGIQIDNINNLTIANSTISGNSNQGIELDNMLGTLSFNQLMLTGNGNEGLHLDNNNGDTVNFGLSGSTITGNTQGLEIVDTGGTFNISNSTISTNNSEGILIDNNDGDTATINISNVMMDANLDNAIQIRETAGSVSITNSTFTNHTADIGGNRGVINYNDTATGGTLSFSVTGSTFSGNDTAHGGGNDADIMFNTTGSGDGTNTITIQNNTFNDGDRAIRIQSAGTSMTTATISGNTIGQTTALNDNGITLQGRDTSTFNSTITGNNISNVGNNGIFVDPRNASLGTTTITNNTITSSGSRGIDVSTRGTTARTAVITGNTIDQSGSDGIRGRTIDTATLNFTVQNNTISNSTDDGIEANANAAGSTINATINGNNVSTSGDSDFVASGAGTCNTCTGP